MRHQSGLFVQFFLMLLFVSIYSCSPKVYGKMSGSNPEYSALISNKVFAKANSEMDTIIGIETVVELPGKKILETGRKMALDEKTVIKGSCWNWVNEVFNRAGYGQNKQIAFKSKKSGPYADLNLIKPGDWLFYINYSYRGIEHSGIFVYWKDFEKKLGVILSYGGRNRAEHGRYLTYDLKSVYYITRAVDK